MALDIEFRYDCFPSFFFSFWPVHIFFYDLLWSYSFRGPQKYRPHYRLIERGRPPHCQCAFPSSKGHWTLACRSAEESPGSGPPPLLAPSPVFPISAPIEKSPGASLETESRTCLKITRNDLLFLSHPVISWVTFLRLTVSVSNSPPFFLFSFLLQWRGWMWRLFSPSLKGICFFQRLTRWKVWMFIYLQSRKLNSVSRKALPIQKAHYWPLCCSTSLRKSDIVLFVFGFLVSDHRIFIS